MVPSYYGYVQAQATNRQTYIHTDIHSTSQQSLVQVSFIVGLVLSRSRKLTFLLLLVFVKLYLHKLLNVSSEGPIDMPPQFRCFYVYTEIKFKWYSTKQFYKGESRGLTNGSGSEIVRS